MLGWGSLLWDRGTLNILPKESEGDTGFSSTCDWLEGGPIFPLEFSRISKTRNGALTLVIDETNGIELPVWFATSKHTDLNRAIRNLREREGTGARMIGYARHDGRFRSCGMSDELLEKTCLWLQGKAFYAVIWTGLASNFKDKTSKDFGVNTAIDYLESLDGEGEKKAREYIAKAPESIQTPIRMNARRLLNWQV